MRPNNANSAIAMPSYLVVLATVLLVARVFFAMFDTAEQDPSPIQWLNLDQLAAQHAKTSDLIFYYFTAQWSDACTTMDRSAFRDRTVVAKLNKEYLPVRIDDPMQSAPDKHRHGIQAVEQKYGVTLFPSIVVVLGDGTFVNSKLGACSARALDVFITGCQIKAGYCRALNLFVADPEECARQLRGWLKTCDWSDDDAVYASAYSVAGFRIAKDEKAAQDVIGLCNKNIRKGYSQTWPWLILGYQKGTLSEKDLFDQVEADHEALTTAKFFVAMNMRAHGHPDTASELMKWIYVNGSRDTEAFRLAREEMTAPETK